MWTNLFHSVSEQTQYASPIGRCFCCAISQMQVERMGHVSQLKDLNSDTSRHQGMVHRLTEERNAERARAQELEMKLRQMAADASVQAQLAQLTAWRSQLDREKQLLSDRCVLCWGHQTLHCFKELCA